MNNKTNNNHIHIKRLCAVSIFCALAYVCVFLIRFKVSFLTFDLKDAIMAIAAMYFGPIYGLVIPVTVSLLEFLTISDTGVYGLIMNILSSTAFCFIASSIYKFRKNLFGAIISLVTSVVVMTGVMLAANLFITPYYMGVTVSEVKALIPGLFFPFNLIKGIINAALVMLLYKPFSDALKISGIMKSTITEDQHHRMSIKGRIFIILLSVAVLAGAVALLFFALDASLV